MRRLVVLTVVVLGVFAACSDDSPSSSSTSATTGGTVAAATTPAQATAADTTPPVTSPAATTPPVSSRPATTEVALIAGWEEVTASGECMCADGSPYSYWIHRADPDKVVFFLQGGGACIDANTCRFGSIAYRSAIGAADDPNGFSSGVFDFTDTRNPLANYSFVYAPYCTGDVHLGNASHEYGPELTVQHKGYVNASAALNALATEFPHATQLVVTGESAGSVPTPLYAGLAHDLLPTAAITVLADGSGGYPDDPAVNARLGTVWGAVIPPWPENDGLTVADWGAPDLFMQAAKHDPQIIFGRHDYAFDFVQKIFTGLLGFQTDDLVSVIDANETEIEQSGVDLRSYIAPGQGHTVLSSPTFYTETVEGVLLVDWVSDLIRRQPDLDVHCTDCTAPG